MSAYRNDLDAALARNHDLERRVEELESALGATTPTRAPRTIPGVAPGPFADLVEARERQLRHQQEQQLSAEERDRNAKIDRYARRPLRIAVARTADTTRITITRPILRAIFGENVFGGFVISTFSIGIMVMILAGALFSMSNLLPLSLAILAAIAIWTAIILAANTVYAYATTSNLHLDLTAAGLFALHTGNPRHARLLGRTPYLTATLDASPRAESMHSASFRYGASTVDVSLLTDRDIAALRTVLTPYIQLSR